MTAPTEESRDVIAGVAGQHRRTPVTCACTCGWRRPDGIRKPIDGGRHATPDEWASHVADEIVKALDLDARDRAAEKRGAAKALRDPRVKLEGDR